MNEEIKDIFECLRKYANLTPDAIDDLYYLEGYIENLQQRVEQLEQALKNTKDTYDDVTYEMNEKVEQLENIIKENENATNILLQKYNELENIIKEAIEYIDKQLNNPMAYERNVLKNTFNILNKGSENNV